MPMREFVAKMEAVVDSLDDLSQAVPAGNEPFVREALMIRDAFAKRIQAIRGLYLAHSRNSGAETPQNATSAQETPS